MKVLAVVDGTTGAGLRQAQALAGFLQDGLSGDVQAETLVFYSDQRERERLIGAAPTRAVRLVKTAARRPDRIVQILADVARRDDVSLFLFGPGPAGSERATRLAYRTGGGFVTDAATLQLQADRLICHKAVYSAHMTGRFEVTARPWSAGIDGGWSAGRPSHEHVILSETDESAIEAPSPFEDVELLDLPSTGDLTGARFLVVAGRGAGDRDGIERIAAAARRMGAAFGVTRPAAMNAWAPLDRIVGVSASRAAPTVCIVVGASGAPAFYWGIEKAGFIVAIDQDERAPIVRNADVVIIDDGVAVIEELADLIAPDSHAG